MANMSGYSSAQIMAMQRDAERRVQEMRRVAQDKLRQTDTAILHGGAPPPPPPPAHTPHPGSSIPVHHHPHGGPGGPGKPPPPPPPEAHPAPPPPDAECPSFPAEVVPNALTGILDRLGLDSESVLLIVMLLLLVNEGADAMLIMALVYILL